MNTRLSEWRRRNLAPLGRRGRLLEGLAISVLTSTLSFVVPLMVACTACPPGSEGACPRTDDLHSGNFVKFGCRHVGGRGYYNDLATLFFNTQVGGRGGPGRGGEGRGGARREGLGCREGCGSVGCRYKPQLWWWCGWMA